jgi:hypothetical protein
MGTTGREKLRGEAAARDERLCQWCDHPSEYHEHFARPRKCLIDPCGCLKFLAIWKE